MQSAVDAATPAGPAGSPPAVAGWNDPTLGAKMQAMQTAVDGAAGGSAPPSGQTPAKPDGKIHGGIANLGAGTSNAVAGTLGGPVDLVTGALNLIPRGINAATGTSLPIIQNPVAGSDWWRSAMGVIGADPRNVAADDFGDRFLRGVGEGVAGTLLPMGAAGQVGRALDAVGAAAPVARGVAQTMAAPSALGAGAAGAASGAGGAVAEETVPDDYRPVANMVGQLAGGGITSAAETAAAGLGRAAGNGARAFLGPVSSTNPIAQFAARRVGADIAPQVITDAAGNSYVASPTQMGVVQNRLAQAAGTTPGSLADVIPSAADASLVPGSQPTLGQVTGNTRVLGLERTLRTANREPFTSAEAANNNARLEALRNLEDPATQAYTAGQYFSRRAAQIDADTDAAITRARQDATPILDGMGGHGTAAHYGQEIAGHVNAAHAPVVKAARDAEELAAGRARQADEALGGHAEGRSDATTRQVYGDAVRQSVKGILDTGNAQISRLYRAIDPDGTARLNVGPLRGQARELRQEMIPGSGVKFSDREEHWIGTAEKMPPVVPFKLLQATRRGLGEAITEARLEGKASEVRRLALLKQAVDQSTQQAMERAAAVEAPHVIAGHLAPEESVLGRLAGHAQEVGAPDAGTMVYTPSGRSIGVRYRVADAGALRGSHTTGMEPNPDYPAELQPRDRTRKASAVQVQRIAGNLQPERLGASASAAEGAPIVGPDGVVESGNARYLAVRRALAANGPAAAAYRDYLAKQGYDTSGLREPILVRERTTALSPADRVRFAQEANSEPGLTMSASERAKVDAGRVSDDMLGLYHPGDVTSASNRDFVRSFARNVLEKGEEGGFQTRDGALSLEGIQRVRNALLHRAYGDSGLVSALAESGDEGIRSFGAALTDAAGAMARVRSGVAAGEIDPAVDISRNLVEAASAVRQARVQGISLQDYVGQRDAFGGGVSARAEHLLKLAYGADLSGRAARGKLADYLTTYAARAEQQSTQARLFGQNATADELLRQVGADGGTTSREAGGYASRLADQRPGDAVGGNEARRPSRNNS